MSAKGGSAPHMLNTHHAILHHAGLPDRRLPNRGVPVPPLADGMTEEDCPNPKSNIRNPKLNLRQLIPVMVLLHPILLVDGLISKLMRSIVPLKLFTAPVGN